ncbi:hypothetical protein PRO82_000898 [Candidatus Protochlamydia amoebophila]|nr:hypothetical protein [Candidatus Protochlamydia amoebophila]
MCRIFDVNMPWLLDFMNFIIHDLREDLNAQVTFHQKDGLKVTKLAGDERWSFVGNKKNDPWLWPVLHKKSCQVLVRQIGS